LALVVRVAPLEMQTDELVALALPELLLSPHTFKPENK
jgi:hypothetical protein